jgi:hypothetical protein
VPEVELELGSAPREYLAPPEIYGIRPDGAGTGRSEAQGVHSVHTLFLAHFGAPLPGCLNGPPGRLRDNMKSQPPDANGRPISTARRGGRPVGKRRNHDGESLPSERLMEKRTAVRRDH